MRKAGQRFDSYEEEGVTLKIENAVERGEAVAEIEEKLGMAKGTLTVKENQ